MDKGKQISMKYTISEELLNKVIKGIEEYEMFHEQEYSYRSLQQVIDAKDMEPFYYELLEIKRNG